MKTDFSPRIGVLFLRNFALSVDVLNKGTIMVSYGLNAVAIDSQSERRPPTQQRKLRVTARRHLPSFTAISPSDIYGRQIS